MPKRKSITEANRALVYAKCNGHCAYCGKPLSYKDMTIEHIRPLAKGGSNSLTNLLPACNLCNSTKGTLSLKEYRKLIQQSYVTLQLESPLFNVLERYEIIKLNQSLQKPVVFYFEKLEQKRLEKKRKK